MTGLWPEWDNDCGGPQFDASLLDPIRQEMDIYWLVDSNSHFTHVTSNILTIDHLFSSI